MRLIDEWHFVLRRAWSVRLMIIAGLLSGAEVVISVMASYEVDPHVPPGAFAGLSGLVTLAAFIARFVAQERSQQ